MGRQATGWQRLTTYWSVGVCQRFMLGGRGPGGGVVCHKCGKEGHIVRQCPSLNNPDFKKDPMKVAASHQPPNHPRTADLVAVVW